MNRYRIFHVTEFQYDGPVSESYNELHLRPRQDEEQTCVSFRLTTSPSSRITSYVDSQDNWVHTFNVLPEHKHLRVESDSVVLVQEPRALPTGGMTLEELDSSGEVFDDLYDMLAETVYVPHTPELRTLVADIEGECDGTVAGFALTAIETIHKRFRYEKGATHVSSSISDVLAAGAGVCQDFAHLMLAVARIRGLPARYVSGYLVPRRTAEPGASVEEVIGGQASHAWIEVYIPGSGWIGLDPTLGREVCRQHVRVAYGRDYGDVPPVRGVYKGHAGQRLSVDVRVRPALDSEGWEHLQETAAGPVVDEVVDEPPQQQQQQQQQQQ
jgi:transglutaminase-like putative cysteine protease